MPTVLELAGAKIPDMVEGKSMVPLVRGEEKGEHEIAVSSTGLPLHGDRHTDGRTMTATTKEWALLMGRSDILGKEVSGKRIQTELYHLPTDPNQTKNMYVDKKEVTIELHSKTMKFLESMKADREVLDLWKRLE